MGLQFCGWPTGVLTSNVQFSSPLPTIGSGLGLPEGNSNSFLTSSVPTSKSESPALQTEKTASATCAAVEVAKPVDHPNPKPIPEGKNGQSGGTVWIISSAAMLLQFIFSNFSNLIVIVKKNLLSLYVCLALEMQYGWWRITDPEDLKSLHKVLHLRGIREKALQKQIQKHMDYITLACIKNKDGR